MQREKQTKVLANFNIVGTFPLYYRKILFKK